LDYLVGFTLSPVLWRKLPGARSAGRVQSVALRLICDRELEIEMFRKQEYWTLEALLKTQRNEDVRARLQAIGGKALKKLDIKDEKQAMAIKQAIEGGRYTVAAVEKKSVRRHPQAPFTTSTLQQEASRKLGMSASRTMQIAQRLYEGVDIGGETTGLITYMRTDGVQMAPEAIDAIRREIRDAYGPRYAPSAPREYKTKAKNAQEAHEAIRPTDVKRRPAEVRRYLSDEDAKLYALIWQRAVASQMSSAELEQTTADIETRGRDGVTYGLRATGSVVIFDGFLKLYEEGRDEKYNPVDHVTEEDDEDSRRLPALALGDDLRNETVEAKQHFTEPPPRYSEATLVKKMEELGIGRPSTYASTLAVLRDREYVRLEKKRLVPEDKGRLVTAFLESFFKRYVEYDFTADLEEKLDLISDDKLEWKDVLRSFWR
ncbi:MAG: type I DNA topoisomerase, partial [Hydrogenophilaceae bacterium]|nr:type I DNA topoisomerase [Hydrogenophilaceae bacterium]